jgi:hypothetical protein
MAVMTIKGGKSGPKTVPTAPQHAAFVLGSRPAGVRTPPVPRIKPVLEQRQYGKTVAPDPSSGFGNTGLTSRS